MSIVKRILRYFDFKFDNYISIYAVGILQYFVYILVIISMFSYLFSFNPETSFMKRLLVVIVSLPIFIVLVRVSFEFLVSMIKVAQNTEEIKETIKSKNSNS